jgi:hypothetical protein
MGIRGAVEVPTPVMTTPVEVPVKWEDDVDLQAAIMAS